MFMKPIRECLLSVLRNEISIIDFEQWLYDNEDELESVIGKEDYFTLINLNYKSKFVRDELENCLIRILGFQSYEEFRIKDLLTTLIYTEEEEFFIHSCSQIYDKYCEGYSFFRIIALKYIIYDFDEQLEDLRNRGVFLKQEKQEILKEGKRLLNYINDGSITILGQKKYSDFRDENERIEEKY